MNPCLRCGAVLSCAVVAVCGQQTLVDTVQQYASKYMWFTYECVHCIVRLMMMHQAVANALAFDNTLMEVFERALRVYVMGPSPVACASPVACVPALGTRGGRGWTFAM